MMDALAVPKQGEYLDGRLWFDRKGDRVTIGLTGRAVTWLGEIESVDLPTENEEFEQGDVMLSIEGTGGTLEVVCPAGGKVDEINDAAGANPDLVTEDPFEEGWLVKIAVKDPQELSSAPSRSSDDDA